MNDRAAIRNNHYAEVKKVRTERFPGPNAISDSAYMAPTFTWKGFLSSLEIGEIRECNKNPDRSIRYWSEKLGMCFARVTKNGEHHVKRIA